MLEGWYCRTMANEQAAQQDEPITRNGNNDDEEEDSGTDESVPEQSNSQSVGINNNTSARAQYIYLKRKLKYLIFENEFFQDSLRANQRRLLKVSRDRAFLLERLAQYEKPENTTSDSDATESSEDEATKKRLKTPTLNGAQRGRKKKQPLAEQTDNAMHEEADLAATQLSATQQNAVPEAELEIEQVDNQGHMTAAEVERHLQGRQTVLELMPERAPATVPSEMFSHEEPAQEIELQEHIIDGSSPSHVAAEECVPMEYSN